MKLFFEGAAQELIDLLNFKTANPFKVEPAVVNEDNVKLYEATVCIIAIKDLNKVFLSKRLETCRTYKDYYCVPGGKLEGDELKNPLEGAKRELLEETGLDIFQDNRYELAEVSDKEPTAKIEYIYKVWLRPGEVPRNTEPHKHTDWILYPFDQAIQLKLIPKLKPLIEAMIKK